VQEEERVTKEEDSVQVGTPTEPAPRDRETLTAAPLEMTRPVAEAARGRSPTMTMMTTNH
jgi:hypothetical protein